MKRPTGVTLLAVWDWLSAGVGLLIFLLFQTIPRLTWLDETNPVIRDFARTLSTHWSTFLLPVGAGVFLILGIGLWRLRNWARILQIVFAALGIVGVVANAIFSHYLLEKEVSASSFIALSLNVIIVVYLTRRGIKHAFVASHRGISP